MVCFNVWITFCSLRSFAKKRIYCSPNPQLCNNSESCFEVAQYFIGRNLVGKNFRRQKCSSAKTFVTLWQSMVKRLSKMTRWKFWPVNILVTWQELRYFLPTKFLLIRYLACIWFDIILLKSDIELFKVRQNLSNSVL